MIALKGYKFSTKWSNKNWKALIKSQWFILLSSHFSSWEDYKTMLFDWLQTELFESPNKKLISLSKILPAFPNFFTNLCLHKPFRQKVKMSEIKKVITWLQKVRDLAGEATGYAWNEYCQNYWAGHIALAVSLHEPSKVLLYVNGMSQLPQGPAHVENR